MAKKFFTSESLTTLVDTIKSLLDGKASATHTHNYAGSSSTGGAATSANKLNTNAGSTTQPVYFVDGVPKATTYTLGKSVPSDAKFTDTNTHYTSKNVVGGSTATANTTSALTNGNVYLNSVENGAVTSTHKISGSGATTVTTDTSGNIVISSTDNNTTYSAAGSSLGLVKSGGDVTISSGVITVNDDSHNHTIANVDNLQSTLDAKVPTSRTVNGKALSSNITLSASDVGADASGSADTALASAKTYTDGKIDAIVGEGAAETLDTIGEISAAITENQGMLETLNDAIGSKSAKTHTHTVSHTPAGDISETSITPAGTVSQPTFTGTAASHNHSFTGTEVTLNTDFTPAGSVSSTFTGTAASHNHGFTGSAVTSGAPSGTATVASSTHTHKYTPAGTVSQPTFTGTAVTSGASSGTTSVYSITGVGSVPSLSASVENQCLTITFSAGSVPTRSSVTLPSTSHTHSVTAAGTVSKPTFSGTEASTTSISGTATVAKSDHTHSVTAAGTVGNKSVTPAGTISSTFTGIEAEIAIDYTPAGTVGNKSITPAGTVSQPTFTGTAAKHKHTFTGTAATLTTSAANS